MATDKPTGIKREARIRRYVRRKLGATGDSKDPKQLEAMLIAQEHRFAIIIRRFFIDRLEWEKEDPRRSAAKYALFWALLGPGALVATTGIVALFTLGALVWQNMLMQKQFKEQAVFNEAQLAINERQVENQTKERLMKVLEHLYTTNSDGSPAYSRTIRHNAFYDYLALIDEIIIFNFTPGMQLSDLGHLYRPIKLNAGSFSFYRANLKNVTLVNWNVSSIAEATIGNTRLEKCTMGMGEISGESMGSIEFFECRLLSTTIKAESIQKISIVSYKENLNSKDLTIHAATIEEGVFSNSSQVYYPDGEFELSGDSSVEMTETTILVDNFKRALFGSVNLTGSKIDTGFHEVTFKGSFLNAINLKGFIRKGLFEHCSITRSFILDISLEQVRFIKSDLTETSFDDAELNSVIFENCVLLKTDFQGSKLNNVQFVNCDLTYANFSGCDLESVTFDNVKIYGLNLEDATNVPEDFAIQTTDSNRDE